MSGSGGGRGDGYTGSGFGGGGGAPGGADKCSEVREGPINSPKAAVLARVQVGSVLAVEVDRSGARPVIVVKLGAEEAGSLTFFGVFALIDCIEKRQFQYQATVIMITSGAHVVRVEPV